MESIMLHANRYSLQSLFILENVIHKILYIIGLPMQYFCEWPKQYGYDKTMQSIMALFWCFILDIKLPKLIIPISVADPFAEDEGVGTKTGGQDGYIHIRIQQRNGRKTLTTIQGISPEFDFKKIVKVAKKVFAFLFSSQYITLSLIQRIPFFRLGYVCKLEI